MKWRAEVEARAIPVLNYETAHNRDNGTLMLSAEDCLTIVEKAVAETWVTAGNRCNQISRIYLDRSERGPDRKEYFEAYAEACAEMANEFAEFSMERREEPKPKCRCGEAIREEVEGRADRIRRMAEQIYIHNSVSVRDAIEQAKAFEAACYRESLMEKPSDDE